MASTVFSSLNSAQRATLTSYFQELLRKNNTQVLAAVAGGPTQSHVASQALGAHSVIVSLLTDLGVPVDLPPVATDIPGPTEPTTPILY